MLVRKFVKHTKVLCSRAANQASLDQSRLAKTQSHIRATAAWVLGKADPAVRQKLGQFDPANGVVHNLAELLPLDIGDGGGQILDFDQPFAHKNNFGDVVYARDPGLADQLRIER